MVDMANDIKSKIDFDDEVARDFLGDPEKNTKYQDSIRLLIQDVSTWTFGNFFPWYLEMSCDDRERKYIIKKNHGDESFGCPKGTAKEDYYKCECLSTLSTLSSS